jgi:hypothetical protein
VLRDVELGCGWSDAWRGAAGNGGAVFSEDDEMQGASLWLWYVHTFNPHVNVGITASCSLQRGLCVWGDAWRGAAGDGGAILSEDNKMQGAQIDYGIVFIHM